MSHLSIVRNVDLATFCQKLPKLELHAHLNGSLSSTTLKKLNDLQNFDSEGDSREWKEWHQFSDSENQNSLDVCFETFSIAHKLTIAPEYVQIATEDVIKEFYDDNVIYLELRSTPRAVEGRMSKTEYIEAIIRAIKVSETRYPNIIVKLLISVDRKKGYEDAEQNINLAIELSRKYVNYVVGLDLSGDPKYGSAFIKLLDQCRDAGLKITAHCAEVPNPTEVVDILNFKPDRLGHCTCIHPSLNGSKELFEMLLLSKIPVELCPTSNIKCKTVLNYESHHFKYLYEANHPICISTDDKGVFSTSLSREYEYVGKYLGIETNELQKISKSTIHYAFVNESEKMKLTKLFDSMIEELSFIP